MIALWVTLIAAYTTLGVLMLFVGMVVDVETTRAVARSWTQACIRIVGWPVWVLVAIGRLCRTRLTNANELRDDDHFENTGW